ncbi:MAG: PA0069 family radical SAM protein [Phycisphaerales bacterium]|nr:PA0069 family radical SAM protein [Phycisphaerales bacterium]MCB9854819.1 PA0069 family radical SAM protein [Phycisphaerales bacterium]MCB9863709.1 PA0069 family radical SAM protein [Phycisphaerales bacterium]
MALHRVSNPQNPFISEYREWLEAVPETRVEIYEERAKSILSENDSPDIPFRWSVNPYRGCQHGCAYCYARPTHEYLGFGAGSDFETRIVAKVNAPELLERALSRKGWLGESVTFSGVTDCYQPAEATYRLTRGCLEVCLQHANPVGIVTRGRLILRDVDVLADLTRIARARVFMSIPFANDQDARAIEPFAPPPSKRFETLRSLREAGIDVGVMVAPIIPGLNDMQIPEILRMSADAGAVSAAYIPLRLPRNVAPVFFERLKASMPHRAQRVASLIGAMRGGRMSESRFGHRMQGVGAHWESSKSLFEIACDRYGLSAHKSEQDASTDSNRGCSDSSPLTPLRVPARRRPVDSQLTFDFGAE